MYQIFNFERSSVITPIRFGNYSTLVKRISVAKHLLTQATRRGIKVVSNQHILVQLITHLDAEYTGDDRSHFEYIQSYAKELTSSLRINSNRNRIGEQSQNSFFPNKVKEFIIYKEHTFKELKGKWFTWRPVNFIYHPFTSWNFNLRNQNGMDNKYAEVFIEIDIPLLLLQWSYWKKWYSSFNEGKPYKTQFVYQFVLMNLLTSDLDVTFVNRLISRFLDLEVTNEKSNHGIALDTVLRPLEDYIDVIEEGLIKREESLIDSSRVIQLPSGITLFDFLKTKDVFISNQLAGLMSYAYYPYLALLNEVTKINGSRDNRQYTNYLERRLKLLSTGGFFNRFQGLDPKDAQNKLALTIPPI